MARPHKFCNLTGYCRTCGVHNIYASGMNQPCIDDTTNVTAISHLRAFHIALLKQAEESLVAESESEHQPS